MSPQCADVSAFAVVRATRKWRTNLPFVQARAYTPRKISVTQRVTCVTLLCSAGPSRRAARRRRRSFHVALGPRRAAPRIELRFDLRVDAVQPQPLFACRARDVLGRGGAAATCFAGTSQRFPQQKLPSPSSRLSVSLVSPRAQRNTRRHEFRRASDAGGA